MLRLSLRRARGQRRHLTISSLILYRRQNVMVTCFRASQLVQSCGTQARVALSDASCEYLQAAGIGGARALAAEAVPYALHELYGGRSSVTSQQAADGTDVASAARPSKKQKRAMKVNLSIRLPGRTRMRAMMSLRSGCCEYPWCRSAVHGLRVMWKQR